MYHVFLARLDDKDWALGADVEPLYFRKPQEAVQQPCLRAGQDFLKI